jgi:hypothetical protein
MLGKDRGLTATGTGKITADALNFSSGDMSISYPAKDNKMLNK